MAIIYSYPKKTTPAGGDFLVITDSEQTAPNKNRTKSLTVGDLASFVITSKSGITGSGTINTLPKFTSASVLGDSEITDTGSVIQMGTSGDPTLYIDTVGKNVGFRTTTPGSAFDVNGTMRVRNQLNVGNTVEQNLYVEGGAGGQYVKMGNYKVPGGAFPDNGNYFGISGAENQPKYVAAFGNAGKVVQERRIVTIKLSGDAFKLLNTTGTTLIPAPGADSVIVPYEILAHYTGGTAGSWPTNPTTTASIGFCTTAGCNYATQFVKIFQFSNAMLQDTNPWYLIRSNQTLGGAQTTSLNKPLLLKATNNIVTAPAGDLYLQIRYALVNRTAGLINNVDVTKTTN